jgi:MFS family permease
LLTFGFCVAGMNPHLAGILTGKGFTIVFTGTVLAIVSAANTIGNIVIGAINDKAGIRAVMTWMFVCAVAAMIFLFVGSSNSSVIIFAVLFGLFMPASGSLVAMLTASTFGMKSFTQMLGISNGIIGFVGIFASVVIGILRDVSGTYNLSIVVSVVLVALGFIAFWPAFAKSRKFFR